ncbi:MAG: maleylpyruvate isomerase family mycothiol-dependent enzyme [Actinomycetota bacterium]|nr:maleylpyruvate isomerase family mycothiol-dependent enzyme [Actinomycetota bacterium]
MSHRNVAADTAQLRSDAARIAELAGSGPLDAAVPDCPGWALRDLVVHLGSVHRWATECARGGREPSGRWQDLHHDVADDELTSWFAEGADALATTLDELAPDAPTWTPFPIESPTVAVWIRRQTHETSLHRRDAEGALGVIGPIDAALAADGVDEYLGVIVPRIVQRDGRGLPVGSAHFHCTDTDGEWTVEVVDGDYVLDRSHRKGDAAVRGTAEALLLGLWGRDGGTPLEVLGDAGVAEAWMAIGGN